MSWIRELIRRILRWLAGCPTGTLSITPPSGPSGTSVTFTITGLRAGDAITLQIPPGTVAGTADAQGNYSFTTQVFDEPRRIPITATTGSGLCEDTLRGSFTVTQ